MLIHVLLVWLLLSIGFLVSSNSCSRNSLISSSHLFLGLPIAVLILYLVLSSGFQSAAFLNHLSLGEVAILSASLHFIILFLFLTVRDRKVSQYECALQGAAVWQRKTEAVGWVCPRSDRHVVELCKAVLWERKLVGGALTKFSFVWKDGLYSLEDIASFRLKHRCGSSRCVEDSACAAEEV